MKVIAKMFLEQVADHVRTYGGMNSTVAVFKDGDCDTTEVDGPDEAKQMMIDAVLHGADAVATASEVQIGKDGEGLFATFEDASGCEMYIAEIHRDEGISLSDWQAQKPSGIFENVFAQAGRS